MERSEKRCQKKCPKHTFLLNPSHYYAVLSRPLQASFCPMSEEGFSITPRFNNDYHHFTVSFCLPVDDVILGQLQQKLSKNLDFYREEHEKYKMDHTYEKSNIFEPKLKYKQNYCNVCKVDIYDYLEVHQTFIKHIRSEDHKKKLNENQFSFHINQLCEKMKQTAQLFPQLQINATQQGDFNQENELILNEYNNQSHGVQPKKENYQFLKLFQSQRNEPLQNNKQLQAYTDSINEQKFLVSFDEKKLIVKNPPFSPIKKYSEMTEGTGLAFNLRPITFHGSQSEINADL